MTLINERSGTVVASSVDMAITRQARRHGLLGRTSLADDAAMFISPCLAVHTVGMPFAIDVAFVDNTGRAVRLVHNLRPWRIAGALRGRSVIELAAGRLRHCGVQVGDRLSLREPGC
jgi:uncharacterized membrane protein (UPF0127 family)